VTRLDRRLELGRFAGQEMTSVNLRCKTRSAYPEDGSCILDLKVEQVQAVTVTAVIIPEM